MPKNVRTRKAKRNAAKGQGQDEDMRIFDVQEILCEIEGKWVPCTDYEAYYDASVVFDDGIPVGDPTPITLFCTHHEAEDLDAKGRSKKVRKHLESKGLEVAE